jgi:hypothetical protein
MVLLDFSPVVLLWAVPAEVFSLLLSSFSNEFRYQQ